MNLKNLIYPFILLLLISCGDQAINSAKGVDETVDSDPFAETFLDSKNVDTNKGDTDDDEELEIIVGNDEPAIDIPQVQISDPGPPMETSIPTANYFYSIEKNEIISNSNYQNIDSQDEIKLRLKLNVDSADIGKKVDIFIVFVRKINGVQTVFQKSGKNFIQWNGSRDTLLPAYAGVTLAESQEDIVFAGKLQSVIGKVNLYFGYTIADKLFSGITYNDDKELAFYVH